MSNIYDLADTWNNGATTFTAIKMNVTDSASNAASLLMDLQVAAASKFSVSKTGIASTRGASGVDPAMDGANGYFALAVSGTNRMQLSQNDFRILSSSSINWSSSGSSVASVDTSLVRDAADTVAQRRGTNAQTKRLYGTYTDASNYRRVSLAMTTAGVATLLPEGAGTGASGNVLHISGLPTSNPGAGILWNNAGTPAIGT